MDVSEPKFPAQAHPPITVLVVSNAPAIGSRSYDSRRIENLTRETEILQKLTSLIAVAFIGIAAAGMISTQARAAPILDVVGGQLLGARNVSILGSLYDVEFKDGTCADLFDGCDEASDFTFTTVNGAHGAALALLNQVFLDDPLLGLFDADPELTQGCENLGVCVSIIPYAAIGRNMFDARAAFNYYPPFDNLDQGDLVDRRNRESYDSDGDAFHTFVLFSPATQDPEPEPAVIPEPGSLFLFGAGLLGLVSTSRRRKPLSNASSA